MTEQLKNSRLPIIKMRIGVYLFAATVLLGMDHSFISSTKAQSEGTKYNLSVINDDKVSGYGPKYQSELKIPPKSNPISELYITPRKFSNFKVNAPKEKIRLVQPKNKKKSIKARIAPAPIPIPIKKVIKTIAVPSLTQKPMSLKKKPPANVSTSKSIKKVKKVVAVPKPLSIKKSGKAVSNFISAPEDRKASPSVPPLPPKLAKASEPEAPNEQMDKQSPSVKIALGQTIQIKFDETATKLPEIMKDTLRKLADGVRDKKGLWLRLKAYADAEGMTASKARRLSLSRALSVRSFLIESGIQSTRIGVMALGNKSSDTPKNRVDISIAKR